MLVTETITFGASRSQVATGATIVKSLRVEPLRANSHVCFVGDSTLTQTGTTGVVRNLAVPPASSGILDFYLERGVGEHKFDASEYYVWGTTSEGATVSYETL